MPENRTKGRVGPGASMVSTSASVSAHPKPAARIVGLPDDVGGTSQRTTRLDVQTGHSTKIDWRQNPTNSSFSRSSGTAARDQRKTSESGASVSNHGHPQGSGGALASLTIKRSERSAGSVQSFTQSPIALTRDAGNVQEDLPHGDASALAGIASRQDRPAQSATLATEPVISTRAFSSPSALMANTASVEKKPGAEASKSLAALSASGGAATAAAENSIPARGPAGTTSGIGVGENKNVFGKIWHGIRGAGRTIGHGVRGAGRTIGHAFSNAWQHVKSFVNGAAHDVSQLSDAAWNKLKEGAQATVKIGNQVVTGIKRGADFVVSTAREVGNTLKSFGLDAYNWAKSVGGAVMSNASSFMHKTALNSWNSMKGWVEKAISKLGRIGNLIPGWAKTGANGVQNALDMANRGVVLAGGKDAKFHLSSYNDAVRVRAGVTAEAVIEGVTFKHDVGLEAQIKNFAPWGVGLGLQALFESKQGLGSLGSFTLDAKESIRLGPQGKLQWGPDHHGPSVFYVDNDNLELQAGVEASLKLTGNRRIVLSTAVSGGLNWSVKSDYWQNVLTPDRGYVQVQVGGKAEDKILGAKVNTPIGSVEPYAKVEGGAGLTLFKANITIPQPSSQSTSAVA